MAKVEETIFKGILHASVINCVMKSLLLPSTWDKNINLVFASLTALAFNNYLI